MQTRVAGSRPLRVSSSLIWSNSGDNSSSASTVNPRCSYRGRFQGTSLKVVSVTAERPSSSAHRSTAPMRARPRPFPWSLRLDAHLLDVSAAVHDVDDHVADRAIGRIRRHPGPAVERVPDQHVRAHGFVTCHVRHADLGEPDAGRAFDRALVFGVVGPCGSDHPGRGSGMRPAQAPATSMRTSARFFVPRPLRPRRRSACRSPS